MALKLEDKKVIVAEVNEAAGNALSAVVADYRGMEVGALTEMREKARNGKIYLRVVRNTLAKRAVAGTEFECLTDALVGPSLIGFSLEEPSAAAKLFKDIAKENDQLEIRWSTSRCISSGCGCEAANEGRSDCNADERDDRTCCQVRTYDERGSR